MIRKCKSCTERNGEFQRIEGTSNHRWEEISIFQSVISGSYPMSNTLPDQKTFFGGQAFLIAPSNRRSCVFRCFRSTYSQLKKFLVSTWNLLNSGCPLSLMSFLAIAPTSRNILGLVAFFVSVQTTHKAVSTGELLYKCHEFSECCSSRGLIN